MMRYLSLLPIVPALLCGVAVDCALYGLAAASFVAVGWLLWLLHVTVASE